MSVRKAVSFRLGPADIAFLSRNGLQATEQLRLDLALVRSLEEALLCQNGDKLLVRDLRKLVTGKKG